MLKALSIKQPWASLIAHGIKDIENRTWKTNYRGRIFIHASFRPAFISGYVQNLPVGFWTGLREAQKHLLLNSFQDKGAIIGEVDIVDCVEDHPSIWAEKTERIFNINSGKFLPKSSVYNWVLANPVLYDEPILNVKGKLSFWEFTKP